MSAFVMKQYKVTCTKQSIGVIENVDKINKKKINKITDKYLIVCEQTDATGIDPETATDEQFEQWLKDNPTIISKKSIRNIKTCLINNCNVTILIKIRYKTYYGYVIQLSNRSYGNEYLIQYYYGLDNEFRYLSVKWSDNEFFVSDYKFD